MKKLTQKLVLSVITMALVVVALGTSTFAWFTLTNEASVQKFEAQITAGQGIEISLGTPATGYTLDANSTWYTVLPSTIIQAYVTNVYTTDFEFNNVSSADGRTFTGLDLTDSAITSPTSGWLSIPLYFRSATSQDIVWNSAELSGSNTPKSWTVNVDSFTHRYESSLPVNYGTDEPGFTTLTVDAWTGARVSVTGSVGLSTPTTQTLVYQEAASTTGVFNSTETLDAYKLTQNTTTLKYEIGTGNYGSASYLLSTDKSLQLTNMPTVVTATTSVNGSILTLKQGLLTGFPNAATYHSGTATVRVWIEGWDADTFDAIFETTLGVQLGFGTADATA